MYTSESALLYPIIGYLYLWIRYRNREKINEALVKNYENSYSVAGFMVIWKPIGFLFLSLIAMGLAACVIGIFRFGLSS
jgi:hypothetical protein